MARQWTSAAARRLLTLAGGAPDITTAVASVANRFLEGVECPPTDLEALGRSVNVLRFEAEELPIAGELRRVPGGFVVVYSSFLGAARRRFTIAHEIAHAVFELTGPSCPRTGRELERLCDMLATEFLMPKSVFLRGCGIRNDLTWERIEELSKRFRTSLSATSLRCAELLGVTVFEVENNEVTWAYGSVRRGPVSRLDGDLRLAIERTKQRESVSEDMYVTTDLQRCGLWKVEGKAIGDKDRALVLMIPKNRHLNAG